MGKRVNFISNLSNLCQEGHLETLHSSGTCFQTTSIAEERLSIFRIILKTCISSHANFNDILTALPRDGQISSSIDLTGDIPQFMRFFPKEGIYKKCRPTKKHVISPKVFISNRKSLEMYTCSNFANWNIYMSHFNL